MIAKIKNYFENLSVKNKLLIIILSVSLVCVIISMFSISVVGLRNIKKQIETELLITGKLLANRVNAAIEFNNNSSAIESLNALEINKSVSRACIYNKGGREFASYFAGTFTGGNCPKLKEPNLYQSDKNYSLYRLITSQVDNTVIGYLFIETNLDRATEYVKNLLIIGLTIFSIVIFLAFILANFFQRSISGPIQYLINKSSEDAALLKQNPDSTQSNNELVKLELILRGIISKINKLEVESKIRDKEIENVIKNSESTIGYLSSELKHPLEATIAFGDIISSRAIGEIDSEYIAYYNDVYLTVFYFYGIINDTMSFFKKHLKLQKGKTKKIIISDSIENIVTAIKLEKPDYLKDFNIKSDFIVDDSLPELKIDYDILQELILNSLFVYAKYLKFLDRHEINLKITAKRDLQDGDSEKFKIEIECEDLQGESIANVLENHRDYQNDVHLLRSKLQYMKYLVSYDGGYLDFGSDLRKMSRMLILFPWKQVYNNDAEEETEEITRQSIEDSIRKIVEVVG